MQEMVAHNSNSPVCVWVLGFLLFSFLCLRKPKSPREKRARIPSPLPFISSPLPSLLADPHTSSLSIAFFFSQFETVRSHRLSRFFRRISSIQGQIQEFANC